MAIEPDWEEVCDWAPTPIAVFGLDGKLLHLNGRAARAFRDEGVPASDDLVGSTWQETFPFLLDSPFRAGFDEVAGSPSGMEFVIPSLQARSGPYRVTLRRLTSESIATFFVAAADLERRWLDTVDELEQARDRLHESEAFRRRYPFGSTGVFDDSLRYLSVAGGGWSEMGIDVDRMEGRTFREVWNPETAELLEELGRVALAGREAMTRITLEDEAYEIWAGPVPTAAGGARGMFLSRDVSQEYRFAEEVRLLRQASSAARLGITVVDLAEPDEPLVHVNEGFAWITGYSRAESLGRNCRFLQGPDTDQATVARMRTAIEQRDTFHDTILNYRKDGTPFWNRLTLSPFSEVHADTRYVGIQEDVTEIREAEVERDHQRRLSELGMLAGSIAHDFNNILMESRGRLTICEDSNALKEIRDELQDLDRTLQGGKTLVRQLLAYARRSTPGDDADVGPALVREAVPAVVRLLPHNVKVEMSRPEEDLPVRLGPLRVEQIFLNLAKNAAEAMPEGGTLRVAVARDATPGWVRWTVSDDGAGIPQDMQDRIFDAFFTTKGSGGTGLGLSSVRLIVERAEGSIEVASAVDQGTTFTIRLPLARGLPPQTSDARTEAERKPRPGRLKGLRLLLVEDKPGIRDVMRRLLERRGLEVITAPDGAAGFERFQTAREPFDIVVADRDMPRMTGDRLLREITETTDPEDCPWLVLMSGDLSNGSVELPEDTTLVSKPFEVEELIAVLEGEVSDREARADPT